MPTTVYFLRFTNVGGHTCTITGHPRLHVAGPASLHENHVVYGLGNAALGHIPISRVTLTPGHRAVSQVAFGGSVGWTGCVSPVWRVTAPGSHGHGIRLDMPATTTAQLCDKMPVEVSPVYAAGHGPARRRQTTPTRSQETMTRKTAYTTGLAILRQFLGQWSDHGLAKAARRFLQPEFRPLPGQSGPKLLSGKVVDFRPSSWTSPDQFTLDVDMNLQFAGPPEQRGAWGQGRNERFVTFTRIPGTQRYLLALATSP